MDTGAANSVKVGLALGSGAARGWAHIGVLRALAEAGIRPDIVCGTSIGALVGAAYCAGHLDELDAWAQGLTLQAVISYLDISMSGGIIKGNRLFDFFRQTFADQDIASLPLRFAAVATDLASGHEVWLEEGRLLEAVRASITLPGLVKPVEREGNWLVDGGLVNPVPVSLCRAMGADVVIAVDLNSDLVGRHLRKLERRENNEEKSPWLPAPFLARIQDRLAAFNIQLARSNGPSVFDVLASSINIMQVRITRTRLAAEPPDVLITPRLAHLGLMEFHRASMAIDEGRRAVAEVEPVLQSLAGGLLAPPPH